ncbi:hypothetical protein DRJ17_04055 [Candidatus Woesearchaeota archaeon]|nr:MAG: hypothetical protein DRJ17_04055 [Candidatus Woesearchaeota archaeon]
MSGLAYKCGFCSYTVTSKSKRDVVTKLALHYIKEHFDEAIDFIERSQYRRKYIKRKVSDILSQHRRKYRDVFDKITDANSLKDMIEEMFRIKDSTNDEELKMILIKTIIKVFTYVVRLTMKEVSKMSDTNKFTFIAKRQL